MDRVCSVCYYRGSNLSEHPSCNLPIQNKEIIVYMNLSVESSHEEEVAQLKYRYVYNKLKEIFEE